MLHNGKSADKTISVIIPTLNEEKYIGRLLSSIRSSGFGGEVIVVDGGSSDRTRDIAKRMNAKVYVKHGNVSVARNFGARKAKGEILVFLDADMVVGKGFFDEIMRKMEKNRIIIYNPLGNDMKSRVSYIAFLFNKIMAQFIKLGMRYVTGGGLAIRRLSFIAAGGFNEALPVAEDMDIVMKATGKIGMAKRNRFSYRRYRRLFDIALFLYSFLTLSDKYWKLKSY